MPVTLLNRRNSSSDANSSQSDPSPIDWLDVSTGIADGNGDKFAVYYDATFESMFCEAKRLCGRDEATCLDIVQETMIKAIRCMKPMDSWRQVLAWSKTVTRSATYDWLRKELSQQRTIERSIERHETGGELIDRQTDLHARLVWVREKLESAEPETRRLIALRYRAGWTLARIGNAVGMKTGAVDGKIRRAITSLKRQAELEYDDE